MASFTSPHRLELYTVTGQKLGQGPQMARRGPDPADRAGLARGGNRPPDRPLRLASQHAAEAGFEPCRADPSGHPAGLVRPGFSCRSGTGLDGLHPRPVGSGNASYAVPSRTWRSARRVLRRRRPTRASSWSSTPSVSRRSVPCSIRPIPRCSSTLPKGRPPESLWLTLVSPAAATQWTRPAWQDGLEPPAPVGRMVHGQVEPVRNRLLGGWPCPGL